MRGIGALLVLVLVAGCARGVPAAGDFRPAVDGELTVATATLPLPGFWEQPGGFEYGLAEALASRFKLRLRVVRVPFERIVAGDLGGADLALSQVTATPDRDRVLDFSQPYLAATPAGLSPAAIPDLAAARDRNWAVTRGTTLATVLADVVRPTAPPALTADEPAALALLAAGSVDAVLLDLPVALVIADRSGGALRVAVQIASDDSLAAALPQGSANREAVDSAVRAFTDDGTIDRLARRWLGADLRDAEADVPVIGRGG
ncbi:transporter substrate-binding domain-containing protein [Phytohabitans houttuyneae]|uniref:Amino acid ABC transporter substrate-binding protein n=1 Tax=Phytohabitans houttuyneae TaxID=1076126 RepID=A0A6V8JY96_9ACTN|nr:transporter substrate-binding domain-containing protein [Phytohabitans houttuyneae]GFJ77723.1 amino acid ABC transporter substrate-binding protein [Phytohabitans houttuyneae]